MKCFLCFSGYLVSIGLCQEVFWFCWKAGKVSLAGIGIGGVGDCAAWLDVVSLAGA